MKRRFALFFAAISKGGQLSTDILLVARRYPSRWIRCVPLLLLCCCYGMDTHRGISQATNGSAEEGLDLDALRAEAAKGQPAAQTLLADCYFAAADFTNAVAWYRRAAAQDHVQAQLALAGCLMTGRGVTKDNAAAAKLLRRTADLIDGGNPASVPGPAPAPASPAGITRASGPQASPSSKTTSPNPAAGGPPPPPPSADTRLDRVTKLLNSEPVLQETKPAPSRPESR
jgi:hypothetical protein